jgi:hypothetical protein
VTTVSLGSKMDELKPGGSNGGERPARTFKHACLSQTLPGLSFAFGQGSGKRKPRFWSRAASFFFGLRARMSGADEKRRVLDLVSWTPKEKNEFSTSSIL